MGLPALILAQALVSYAPTIKNTSLLSEPANYRIPSAVLADAALNITMPDTVRRRRAVMLSDGYYSRLDIHRWAGYGVLPLFAIEYLAGQKLLSRGSQAPLWAEKAHKPAAYALAGIFTVNTVTGLMNLAEASKVEQGRKRRWVHSVMMLAAEAGMVYGVAVAPSLDQIDDRIAGGQRGGWTKHKIATVASMGVATISTLMMYLGKGD